ncbi:MAG: hypothetical protein AAB426_04700 [Myxococcota bacterium]
MATWRGFRTVHRGLVTALTMTALACGGESSNTGFAICGNGVVEDGEACDDGFQDGCGSCNAVCSGAGEVSTCGDGRVCEELEACDDGFQDACGSCNEDCSAVGDDAFCGDAEVCPEFEICDDGYNDGCGSCNASCTAAGTGGSCGDGEVCRELGETCDDGFTDACGSCNANCTAVGAGSVCGDGSVCQETETCDDGYEDACGSCNHDCSGLGFGSVCGDGITCPETDEICDDGFNDACGTCNDDCSAVGTGWTCGDDARCPQAEACDDGNTASNDYCSADCRQVTGSCGDSIAQSNEACDDGNADDGDLCSNGCQLFNPGCTIDNVGNYAPMQLQGIRLTVESHDFEPLCDGWVVLGDRSTNKVRVFNVLTGVTMRSWQLSSPPGEIALDVSTGALYATRAPTTGLERIDLISGARTIIDLPAGANEIIVGEPGEVFVTMDDDYVAHINAASVATRTAAAQPDVDYLGYDAATHKLLVARSGGEIARYDWSISAAPALVLTPDGQSTPTGSGCSSYDGFAFSATAGLVTPVCSFYSAGSYVTPEYGLGNLAVAVGTYSTGAFFDAISYSLDGSLAVLSWDYDLRVMDVTNHLLLQATDHSFGNCGYTDVRQVGMSRGARVAIGFAECGFDNDSGQWFWAVYAP